MKIVARIINKEGLTDREADVLQHLCEGHMRAEIAEKLHRTVSTVSRHIEAIAEKWDAHSAAEIVALAVAKGLVDIRIGPGVIKFLLLAVLIAPQHMEGRNTPRQGRPFPTHARIRTASVGGRAQA